MITKKRRIQKITNEVMAVAHKEKSDPAEFIFVLTGIVASGLAILPEDVRKNVRERIIKELFDTESVEIIKKTILDGSDEIQ